jgi:hypothetical protein
MQIEQAGVRQSRQDRLKFVTTVKDFNEVKWTSLTDCLQNCAPSRRNLKRPHEHLPIFANQSRT